MLGVAFRKEVLDFVMASEAILSSVLIKPPLTEDERALIAEYVSFLYPKNRAAEPAHGRASNSTSDLAIKLSREVEVNPPIRREVVEFVDASQAILSSALLKPFLTEDERSLIAEYVHQLTQEVGRWKREDH
jgi:hypothetical protein